MADGYFMPKEKYEWLTGAVDRLTKDYDAATARAERAEAAEADLRAQLAKTLDALGAGSALRERFVQRALTAEAAIERVREACAARQAGGFAYIRIVDVLAALDGPTDTEGEDRGE